MQNKLKLALVGLAVMATILTFSAADATAASNTPPGSLNVGDWYSLMRKSTTPYVHESNHTSLPKDSVTVKPRATTNH